MFLCSHAQPRPDRRRRAVHGWPFWQVRVHGISISEVVQTAVRRAVRAAIIRENVTIDIYDGNWIRTGRRAVTRRSPLCWLYSARSSEQGPWVRGVVVDRGC